MGESKVLCCPEMGRLKLTGCEADIGRSGKSIVGVCKLGCDEAVSCLGERESCLVDTGEMFGVREGGGLDKGVVGLVMSALAGVEVVGVCWEKVLVTYSVEEL